MLVIPAVGLSMSLISPHGGDTGMASNFTTVYKAYVFLCSAAVFNGTAVFVIRTLAIRDSKRPMTIFLWCCYGSKCTFHLFCSVFFNMPSSIQAISTNKITMKEYLPWVIYLSCSVLFDVLILVLSLSPRLDGLRWQPTLSHISSRFYYDAIFYFTMSLLVSIFNLAWIVTHRHNGLLWAIAGPM